MSSEILITIVLALIISYAILYLIIGYAVRAAMKDQREKAEIQNRLLAKLLEQNGVSKEEIEAMLII